MKRLTLLSVMAAPLLLAACTTAEYRQASNECRVTANASYPVVLEQRMFRRSREVWVPDGSTVCDSTVTTMSQDSSRKSVRTDGPPDDMDDGPRGQRRAPGNASVVRQRSNANSIETTQTRQICRPGTQRMIEYYDEPGMVDINAGGREAYVSSCAATLCMQRFGNDRCKKR